MAKIHKSLTLVLITGFLITLIGCTSGDFPVSTIGLHDKSAENNAGNVNKVNQASLNSMSSQQVSSAQNNNNDTSGTNKPEIVDNLKSIEIENMNDEENSKVTINLPENWYAKEFVFNKDPNFEYNTGKNKQTKKVHSFELYNSLNMDKFNQYGIKGLAGEFYVQSYYRDEPESSRFPNHSEVKSRVYSGEMVLGEGEIFILDCDLPRELRTEKYSTYDMVYVWIPIKNEALAYNMSICVPLGEKVDEYIEMVKKMLNADNQTYLVQEDIEWITMQGGLGITTKVLFAGHDDEKINRIISMINSGAGKMESTEAEINVIHSRARPIGICFQLKDENKAYVWTDYSTKAFENGWSATTLNDRFILDIQNGGKDEYYTIFSKDVAKYLSEGWKDDMPMVNKISVNSGSDKNGEQNVIRDGDKAIVDGDGCTSKEVVIHLRRNGEPKEDYIIGKAIPEFGKWQWSGLITRQFQALDGKKVTLAKDLYDIVAVEDGAGIGICGVIDLREGIEGNSHEN